MLSPDSRWFTVLLGALAMMTAVSIDMSLPALPALAAAFAAAPDRVQLTLSLFLLGYAAGQLVVGPLSDRFGRRWPLLLGLVVYTLAGFACALAPRIELLVAARLVQGVGASVGPILGRAVVRDHFSGRRAAQAFSAITLIMAVAPLLAPLAGGALLARAGWPAIFLCLGAIGLALILATWLGLAESLRRPDPQALRLHRLLANYRAFVANRICLGYAVVNAFVFSGLFAFISGSPFVLIEVYGVPNERYGFYFGLSALALMAGAFTNGRLVRRVPGERVLRIGLAVLAAAGAAALAVAWMRWGGALAIMAPVAAYVFGLGLVLPNATAAAMEPLPHMAGMGAALLGAFQMIGGSLVGYAVSAMYDGTPRAMGAAIAVMGWGAFAIYHLMVKRPAPV